MRHKVKKLLNKEDGFTLVELLAVIVILGIIVAIAIPAVGSVIDRADEDADDAEIALIEDAARLYVTTNENNLEKLNLNDDGNEGRIPVETLLEEGFLEERGNSEPLTGVVQVLRKQSEDSENYTYEYNYKEAVATDNTK